MRLISVCALPAALLAGMLYYPYCETGPTLCLWRLFFGLHCPSCGMTRAWCHLSVGRFAEATDHNPMAWALLAALATVSALGLATIWKGRRSKRDESGALPIVRTK